MIHSIKFYFISIAFLSKVRVGTLHCVNFCINNVDDFMFRVSDLFNHCLFEISIIDINIYIPIYTYIHIYTSKAVA